MLQGFFLDPFFFFFPLSSARREEVETSIDTDDETDDSRERSRGGVGELERSATSGSSEEGVSRISAGGTAA